MNVDACKRCWDKRIRNRRNRLTLLGLSTDDGMDKWEWVMKSMGKEWVRCPETTWLEVGSSDIPKGCPYLLEHVVMDSC